MEDTRTEAQKKVDDEMMEDCYAQLDKYYKELHKHNNEILSELGETAFTDFQKLIEDCEVTDKIDFVEKPHGQNQNEKSGIFKSIWVDQNSVGDSGDSYAGYIYGQITKDKWLRIPYEC
jgi:uncharacterized membrane-anchored protein YhcB (DUF1043 family)